jgi:ABC-2 type transport system ATP-binding protein
MTALIEANNLGKSFGAIHALDGLSLSIPKGGVYGVLGANGAGKSTFFRICLGLIRPSQGQLGILGTPAGDARILRRIGAMIETPRYYPFLTARETLVMLSRASGTDNPRIDQWLTRVGLTDAAERNVHHFSVGMKQRLGIAAALIARPELVILDEPTSGMDPAGIQEIRALLRSLADQDGVTVVLSSHLLDEVQKVCDRVAIFDHGRLISEGRIDSLIAGQERLRLLASPVERVLSILGSSASRDRDGVLVQVSRKDAPALLRTLIAQNIDLTEARWVGGELETFYLQQTGNRHVE